MRRLLAVAATITAVTVPSGAELAPTESTPTPQEFPTLRSMAAQRDAVSITVYNQDFALVREIRTLDLPSGRIADGGSGRLTPGPEVERIGLKFATAPPRSFGSTAGRQLPAGPRLEHDDPHRVAQGCERERSARATDRIDGTTTCKPGFYRA